MEPTIIITLRGFITGGANLLLKVIQKVLCFPKILLAEELSSIN